MQDESFLNDPAMSSPVSGQPLLSSSSGHFYHGNSLGGIHGSVYMALSQDVVRGVVGVPGAPFSLMLPRSLDFAQLEAIMKVEYPNSLDLALLLAACECLWERSEPAGYMDRIISNPFPNTPVHTVIIQHALGDAQVSYVGSYTLARSMGGGTGTMFQSNVIEVNEELFGFKFIPDNMVVTSGALISTYRFPWVEPANEWNLPANATTDTHEGPRRMFSAQEQSFLFFTTGDIVNTCLGPCIGHHW